MLGQLQLILRRGIEHPAQLADSIKEFLRVFDSLAEDTILVGDPRWEALERLAYELRYYAPEEMPATPCWMTSKRSSRFKEPSKDYPDRSPR